MILLKMSNIKNQSIEVLSFSHGLSMPLFGDEITHKRKVGRVVHQDFTFIKYTNELSPLLNLTLCKGEVIDTVSIEFSGIWTADEKNKKQELNFCIEFKNCILTNISISGGDYGNSVETVCFSYGEIEWKYNGKDKKNSSTASWKKE